jgi:hypothetical protein
MGGSEPQIERAARRFAENSLESEFFFSAVRFALFASGRPLALFPVDIRDAFEPLTPSACIRTPLT